MLRPFQYQRLCAVVAALLGLFFGLGWRLYDIQVRRHRELSERAERYTRAIRVIEPWRGEIRDRSGRRLALSAPEKTVWLNLGVCGDDVEGVARTCGLLLKMPCRDIAETIRAARQRPHREGNASLDTVALKRHVAVEEWAAVASAAQLETFGINRGKLTPREKDRLHKLRRYLLSATDSQVRRYPYGESLCHVLGFVSPLADGLGLEGKCGLEKTFNRELAGAFGRCVSEQDASGNELPLRRSEYRLANDGCNLQLTIDFPLQQIVEQALYAAMVQSQARGASAILMDPRTFEVLAMASLPNFNPQEPGASLPETWGNAPTGAMVEPGSTAKMFTLAAMLEAELGNLDSGVYCEQGRYILDGVEVRDHGAYGLLSVREAFAKSSNIGFAKIGVSVGPQRLYRCLTNFGLGHPTGLPLFGSTAGRITAPAQWSLMTLTRAAFGQGFSVSQMQMAIALCAIANDGRLQKPLLVRQIESADGKVARRFAPQFVRRVVSSNTARRIREAFQAVVAPGGTGALAASERFSSGVKTGTAQKSDLHGYRANSYYSSMIGFLPAEAPRLVIAVALDEPQNGYYASAVAAPVFRAIAEQSAVRLGIPADKGALAHGAQALPLATTAGDVSRGSASVRRLVAPAALAAADLSTP